MQFFHEHNTRERASGPRTESACNCIPDKSENSITHNLQQFTSDTITRNRITPGDGCRMEAFTPPSMCGKHAGEYLYPYLDKYVSTIPASATVQNRLLLAGKHLLGGFSGGAGGNATAISIHAVVLAVKLETDQADAWSGENVKAVVKKNQRNMNDTLESKDKGKISYIGVKRAGCPDYHPACQRITSAGSLALILTQYAYHKRGNPYVALVPFDIGEQVGLDRMPTWNSSLVWERWLNKRRPVKPVMGDQGYAHFG